MPSLDFKLGIMQATFNPWIGYFDLIDYVDEFIFLDTIQLNQQSWQTRNKIKINNKEHMISLPIIKNISKEDLLIKDALLDFRKFDFRKKLIKTLDQNYSKAKFFNEVNEFIKSIVLFNTNNLQEYNINLITNISKKLNINTKTRILSQTNFLNSSKKDKLVLEICKHFNCTKYISPIGSKEYLEK